jgi:hypothetical protein
MHYFMIFMLVIYIYVSYVKFLSNRRLLTKFNLIHFNTFVQQNIYSWYCFLNILYDSSFCYLFSLCDGREKWLNTPVFSVILLPCLQIPKVLYTYYYLTWSFLSIFLMMFFFVTNIFISWYFKKSIWYFGTETDYLKSILQWNYWTLKCLCSSYLNFQFNLQWTWVNN